MQSESLHFRNEGRHRRSTYRIPDKSVALTWADAPPRGAIQFKPGRWGCVVSVFATVAAKGRVGAFDRKTYGCWGGGMGLGFCNCYESFPGGIEGFCRFLSHGNENSEDAQRVGERFARWGDRHFADDFLHGERYLKSAQVTRRFLEALPMRDIRAQYVVVKPLDASDPENDDIKSVTLFVDPDQFSALAVLANYAEPDLENVAVPWRRLSDHGHLRLSRIGTGASSCTGGND